MSTMQPFPCDRDWRRYCARCGVKPSVLARHNQLLTVFAETCQRAASSSRVYHHGTSMLFNVCSGGVTDIPPSPGSDSGRKLARAIEVVKPTDGAFVGKTPSGMH